MAPVATVAIASIGEMGAGIARLLSAHDYRVVTNVSGRRSAEDVIIITENPVGFSLLKWYQPIDPSACQVRLNRTGRNG